MWLREAGRAARDLQRSAGRSAGTSLSTRARRRESRADLPQCPGPALSVEMVWGPGRWGTACWGPERYPARPVHWSGRWGTARWTYSLWGRARTRIG